MENTPPQSVNDWAKTLEFLQAPPRAIEAVKILKSEWQDQSRALALQEAQEEMKTKLEAIHTELHNGRMEEAYRLASEALLALD